MLGATAADSGPAAAHVATAEDRRSAGNSGSTTARDEGMTSAPATAWATRAAMRISIVGATADPIAETTKPTRPRLNTRRRPTRSARRPPTGRNAAEAMKKPEATSDTVDSVAFENSSEIEPNARLVAVELKPNST